MASARHDRVKRHLLYSAWATKLFALLTELSWSDVCDTYASGRHFSLMQKKRKAITEYHDTAPLNMKEGRAAEQDLNL